MRITRIFLVIPLMLFLTSTVFVSSGNHSAYACSCMQPLSPAEEMPKYDAVFSGKVIEVIEKQSTWPFESSAYSVFVTLDVYNTWKGDKNETMTVKTAISSASCGFNFEENQEYIVYATAYNDGENLEVDLCSRTGPLSNATEDLQELGPGHSTEFEIGKILPPLKLFKTGVPPEEIQCNDDLQLVIKYNYTPACVRPDSIMKLDERGWTLEEDPIHDNEIKSFDSSEELENTGVTFFGSVFGKMHEIPFSITGAEVSTIIEDAVAASIIISLENVVSDGELIITLPIDLHNSKMNDDEDDDFFILVNGEEVDFDEVITVNDRKLTIQFAKNVETIEIIRAYQI